MHDDARTLIQTAYGHFASGDIPALLEMMTPDVRWQFIGDREAAYTATVHGPAQVGEWFAEVAAADDICRFEPREFLAGADHVTVLGDETTVARSTGKTFETPWVHVWRLDHGRIAGFTGMFDSQAVAAARRAG